MPLRLTIPRAFHPPAAPLGRWVRRRAGDARQAESLYLVAVALVLTAATLASQWSWILLGEAALAPWVLGAHVVLGGLLGWGCLWGWKPAVTVTAHADGLEVTRGDDTLVLAYDDVERTERISADAYHRHWRRYAATRAFVNRLPEELLLLRTATGPVVLGLTSAALDRFETQLTKWLDVEASSLVRAA